MAEGHDEGLLWDHAGENLDTDPLFDSYRAGYSTFYSPAVSNTEGLKLSRDQAEKVLCNLEEAHSIISKYIDRQHSSGVESSQTFSSPNQQTCCYRCLKEFKSVLEKLTNYIIFLSLTLQILDVIVLTIIDFLPKSDERTILIVGATIMIILQVANLLLVIYASIKLANQMMHRSVSGILLIQGYIATLLLFAGVYTATFRLDVGGWKFITEDVIQNPVLLAEAYAKFLFFSVSTGTLCGSSNVLPKGWYNCILVSIQMLLSYTYFASILGQAVMAKTFGLIPHTRADNSILSHSRSRRGSTHSELSVNQTANINQSQ